MPLKDQIVHKERYQIIPRVLIFASKEQKVLLIKGAPDKRLWANLFNGIGGHIEKGEDVLSAARREFLEETGLQLLSPRLRALVTIDTQDNLGIGMYVFSGQASEGKLIASAEGGLEWVPFATLETLPLVEDLPILLPKILAMKPDSPILSLQYRYDETDALQIEILSIE